jgi:hypothetical protein
MTLAAPAPQSPLYRFRIARCGKFLAKLIDRSQQGRGQHAEHQFRFVAFHDCFPWSASSAAASAHAVRNARTLLFRMVLIVAANEVRF